MIGPKTLATIAATAAILVPPGLNSFAGTWQPATGNVSWNVAGNWNPAAIPDGEGASAIFNNALSGSNPAQAGNRIASVDTTSTVGSIEINQDAVNTFRTDIDTAAAAGTFLRFDAAGAGPASVTANSIAGATGNTNFTARMWFTDQTEFNVNNVTATSAAGAVTLTGRMSGSGGITKNGPGLMTMANGGDEGATRDYTGPTIINGGRLRLSPAIPLTGTSSFTVNAGGQLHAQANGTFTLGVGPLNLNGFGPITGPFAGDKGAIRPPTNNVSTINNNVVLQTDASIALFGSATTLSLPGTISGGGKLVMDAVSGQPANHGKLILNTIAPSNTYSGGTNIVQGTIELASANASLGTGDVFVDGLSDRGNGILGSGKLSILAGVLNGIADTATVSLDQGPNGGTVSLGTGIMEYVGGLTLNGVPQPFGTYGSTSSLATYQLDQYFTGSGILVVTQAVPEPASILLFGIATLGFFVTRRGR